MDFFYHTIMLRKIQVGGIFLWNRKKDYPDNTDGGISRPLDRTAGGYGTFEKYSLTGSVVNFLLITSVMLCGPASGFTVAVLSPGAGKISGDRSAVGAYSFYYCGKYHDLRRMVSDCGKREEGQAFFRKCLAVAGGAAAKTAVLYGGIACFAVPYLLVLAEPQASLVSGCFPFQLLLRPWRRDGGSSSASGSEKKR